MLFPNRINAVPLIQTNKKTGQQVLLPGLQGGSILAKKISRLEMKGITKSFGAQYGNRDIDLVLMEGEILGLLGENGAGKTTLVNILFGLYHPDAGQILINGALVRINSPRDSIALGIGMIHQHFMLVNNHTVLENIALGYSQAPFFRPHKYLLKKIDECARSYNLSIDPGKKIWELSAGEQQKVEILNALLRQADLLILDEPTSVLTPGEVQELTGILRAMAAAGHSVIFISHKLNEILSLCHRVQVLRKGMTAGQAPVAGLDKKRLAEMMVGRDVLFSFTRKQQTPGPEMLAVRALSVKGDRGHDAVKRLSFSIHSSEIFGIAGVSGNGQRELVEAVTGLRKSYAGRLFLAGQDITNQSARFMHDQGITHVPEERIKLGIVPNLVVYENSILKHHHKKRFSRFFFLDYDSIKHHAGSLLKKYNVDAADIDQPMKALSGGNIQKFIIGREMEGSPALLVAAHPTYGLDAGAAEYIREQLIKRREEGGAILLVSEDLEELFALCDRIGVMFRGEFMGILDSGHAQIQDIGLMMAGERR